MCGACCLLLSSLRLRANVKVDNLLLYYGRNKVYLNLACSTVQIYQMLQQRAGNFVHFHRCTPFSTLRPRSV